MHLLIATTLCFQIFGPVISVAKFTTEEEAIELANNSIYGLAAAVFTNDAKQSMRVSGALEAGTVWVNSYALLQVQAPFGGFKQSGIGRGESREIKFGWGLDLTPLFTP
jgi:aldehyde dehydrogenase (NAD+)